ncbi:MAG: hypothetical protein WDM86_11110 [Rhizomicrobium sp.]
MQSLLNAVSYFAVVLLVSIPFFFQYRLFRFFDLSLGVVFLVGAYAFLEGSNALWPEWIAIAVAVVAAATCGGLIYLSLFRTLVNLRSAALGLTLCAFGVYILGVNIVAMAFGDELVRSNDVMFSGSVVANGGVLSNAQLTEIILAVSSILIVWSFLKFSKAGRTVRAFADNPALAADIGLAGELPTLLVVVGGAGLMGLVGLLLAADIGVRPTTAFVYLLPGLAAVLAFGTKNIFGVVVGSAIVASIAEITAVALGQQWRDFAIYTAVAVMLTIHARLRQR